MSNPVRFISRLMLTSSQTKGVLELKDVLIGETLESLLTELGHVAVGTDNTPYELVPSLAGNSFFYINRI